MALAAHHNDEGRRLLGDNKSRMGSDCPSARPLHPIETASGKPGGVMSSRGLHICISVILTAWLGAVTLYGQGGPSPVPLINQPLVPTSVAPGSGAFTLTVNGMGFVSPGFAQGSVVTWNGSSRETTFVNSGKLTALIMAADVASAGTALVTVVNPAPGGGTSNVAFFQIIDPTTSVSMSRTDISTGTQPRFVVAGDFSKDNILDLIVVNHSDNTFSYFQGVGNGTFAAPVTFNMAAAGALPIDGVVGDFNGDGNLDLAITHPTSTGLGFGNTVTIHLGDGNGGFPALCRVAARGRVANL